MWIKNGYWNRRQGKCNHMLQEAGHVLFSIESCIKRFLTQDPAGHTNNAHLGLQTCPQSLRVEVLTGRRGSELENWGHRRQKGGMCCFKTLHTEDDAPIAFYLFSKCREFLPGITNYTHFWDSSNWVSSAQIPPSSAHHHPVQINHLWIHPTEKHKSSPINQVYTCIQNF